MHATHAIHEGWGHGPCGPRGAHWFHMTGGRGGKPGRHGPGPGGFGHRGGPFGRGFGPWGPGPGGPKARKGDVRAALLVLLDEEPRNGYGLMQEIEQRSEGVWRPSPGSVYPALAQLEDEGLVRAQERDGRKEFVLTDEGRAHVEEHREQLGEPWKTMSGAMPEGVLDLRQLIGQVAGAAMQAAQAGDAAQGEKVREILVDARKAIYRVLAED